MNNNFEINKTNQVNSKNNKKILDKNLQKLLMKLELVLKTKKNYINEKKNNFNRQKKNLKVIKVTIQAKNEKVLKKIVKHLMFTKKLKRPNTIVKTENTIEMS